MPVLNIIKIFQTIKLWSAQKFGLETRSGELTRKRKTQELFFLHATRLLDLIYIPIKYYQIISNRMGVISCTKFRFNVNKKLGLRLANNKC